jgi:hypothetical protein
MALTRRSLLKAAALSAGCSTIGRVEPLSAARASGERLVPGGGVEPPRPEGRRILSVTLDFRKSKRISVFYRLPLESSRDRCSLD